MKPLLTVAQCNAILACARDTGVELTPAALADIEATVASYATGPFKQELLTLIDLLEAREATR